VKIFSSLNKTSLTLTVKVCGVVERTRVGVLLVVSLVERVGGVGVILSGRSERRGEGGLTVRRLSI